MRGALFVVMAFTGSLSRLCAFVRTPRPTKYDFSVKASKHIASQLQRSGEETKDTIVIDPKKIALLEKLGLGEEQEDKSAIPMTGAELRKDRKNVFSFNKMAYVNMSLRWSFNTNRIIFL